MPDDSRGALPGYEWLQGMLKDPASNEKVKQMRDVADELGCTLAQLAIAWCAANPHVSTVITGASRPEQVVDNFGALDVLPKLDSEKLDRLVKIARG
jgi:aryl-alcohol dehydrogenase-like predicted oxidoreductase